MTLHAKPAKSGHIEDTVLAGLPGLRLGFAACLLVGRAGVTRIDPFAHTPVVRRLCARVCRAANIGMLRSASPQCTPRRRQQSGSTSKAPHSEAVGCPPPRRGNARKRGKLKRQMALMKTTTVEAAIKSLQERSLVDAVAGARTVSL